MRIKGRSRGFSLVELLTVIAIIAILAAIIFPVMTSVKRKANESKCMTQLQQIGAAIQLFKQDNRRYPDILGAEALDASLKPVINGNATPTGPAVAFENAKDKYLFPEYVKSYLLFHCPQSQVTKTTDIAIYQDRQGAWRGVYAYDSYDVLVHGGAIGGKFEGATAEQRYAIKWAADATDVANSGLKPYPPDTAPTTLIDQSDFERQLIFKNPPADTVVTWCSYHEGDSGNGRSQVLFLDGHTDSIPGNETRACKWRLRPKKS